MPNAISSKMLEQIVQNEINDQALEGCTSPSALCHIPIRTVIQGWNMQKTDPAA